MLILGAALGFFLGVLIFFGLRALVPSLFPEQGPVHAGYYVGSLPTSLDGTFARRDYLRMAGLALLGAVACLAVAVSLGWLLLEAAFRNRVAEGLLNGVLFALSILALLCVGGVVLNLFRAIRWRPTRLASEWSPPSPVASLDD